MVAADNVVLAIGSKSVNTLADVVTKKGIGCISVGDARRVAQAIDAIHQGFRAGQDV
jgi:2,4-dienoyl-CoA reductase (NADPH2)